MPVGRNEEIKIKMNEANPEPNQKTDDGELKWILILSPQEKREILFAFQ